MNNINREHLKKLNAIEEKRFLDLHPKSGVLFEKAKGKQFIVTLADVTLSTKQFLNNAQTNVPNLPPIDSSNNDILKGIQDRITITPTKLMAQAIEQAEIKKQETTPQTKMEWNYDTLSWEKVPVVKIMDMGKALYLKKKKVATSKKNQIIIKIKEIKLRPKIGEHDYLTKLKQGIQFLKDGNWENIISFDPAKTKPATSSTWSANDPWMKPTSSRVLPFVERE